MAGTGVGAAAGVGCLLGLECIADQSSLSTLLQRQIALLSCVYSPVPAGREFVVIVGRLCKGTGCVYATGTSVRCLLVLWPFKQSQHAGGSWPPTILCLA